MKISPYILNELEQISPLLASMEKVNVFHAPDGYFDELHERISTYALLNDTPALDVEKKQTQQVPEGYFDALSDTILAKIKATYTDAEKEESLSPELLSLKDKNVFTIPENYFETLSSSIFNKINGDESEIVSPLLLSLKDKNVFTVPQNYFETLSSSITEKIHDNESEIVSPLLLSLRDKNVFTVPQNYFETLAGNIASKVKAPVKIISINKSRSWVRYAAAAVVTGFIAITSLQIFNNLSTHSSSLPEYIQQSFQYKTENDLNAGIAKLSDNDIAKYLEKNGNALDNELLINNSDVSEMPSQTDYLNDENTLNEYLDKIDAAANNNTKP